MFKRSRVKIVFFVITTLILFLFGTLLIIYVSSYVEISQKNHNMIKDYVYSYSLSEPNSKRQNEPKKESLDSPRRRNIPPKENEIMMTEKTVFYSVAKDYNDRIIKVDKPKNDTYTEAEIIEIANKINELNKSYGRTGNIVYMVADKGDYTLTAFTENTVLVESMDTLLRFTILYGIISITALTILTVVFSKKIFSPIEETYNKQKQFISDAGHELKTPISVISANAELLSREIGDNVWLSNILYENERMGILIKQLLELSKTESVEHIAEKTDLSRLVMGEALPFESIAFEKHHKFIYDIQQDISINCNPNQIKQLTAILLDNAVNHSLPEKDITLSVKLKHKHAVISVVNYGESISKTQQKQIFERFYRMDKVRNSSDNHYGLGLAIAKAIVNTHKGRLELSCHDGLVDFSVYLPID